MTTRAGPQTVTDYRGLRSPLLICRVACHVSRRAMRVTSLTVRMAGRGEPGESHDDFSCNYFLRSDDYILCIPVY